VGADPIAKAHFDSLHGISEEVRNTYGHGGFDKKGATVYFHVERLGALPAVLSDVTESPHFSFLPVESHAYADICAVFDDVDRWLNESSRTCNAMTWIRSGLDIRFDPEFRAMLAVAEAESDFDTFLEYHSDMDDQAANMDW
jgi:hypothetical protein